MAKKHLKRYMERLNEIGVALSSTDQIDHLLEMILLYGKSLTHADAGTLYLVVDQRWVRFEIVRTDSLGFAMGGTSGKKITLPPIPLYRADGEPDLRSVVARAILNQQTINLEDAYQTADYDLTKMREFDRQYGYRSRSCLTVPLRIKGEAAVGAIQLINATDPDNGLVIPFSKDDTTMVESMASQAALALHNYRLHHRVKMQLGYQQAIVSIHRIALTRGAWSDKMARVLEQIMAVIRPRSGSRGGLFLTLLRGDDVEIVTEIALGLDAAQLAWCRQLSCDSQRAAVMTVQMLPGGHIVVPIRLEAEHFGTIQIICNDISALVAEESDFLLTVSTILAGVLACDRSQEALRQAKEMADSANQIKGAFLANMSHEIRTPLNAVIGLSDLALQHEMAPKILDYLTKISYSSKTLLRIINDILDFSKIEAGKLEFEQANFWLYELFDRLTDIFRAKINEKQLEWVLDLAEACHYELVGDALRLQQVLLNLIGNAIKFTTTGTITVAVSPVQETAERVTLQFSVRDSGIGIPPEYLHKLFDPFTQADNSTTRRFGGTGLGLSISQRLIQKMGGRLWVTSAVGQGSLFTFTATFGRPAVINDWTMRLPDTLFQLNMLVVDDNEAARQAQHKMLTRLGGVVTGVASGEAAIDAWQQAMAAGQPYQLVLVDWLMPELNGLQTVQRIKELAGEMPPKTILLPLLDCEEQVLAQGALVGIDASIAKPVGCMVLLETILELFGQRGVARIPSVPAAIHHHQEIRQRLGGARVLLVEDNAINRQVASEILSGAGLVVEMAVDGVEAVAKIAQSTFDAVLMDVQMPNMDGYQATRQIRHDPRHQQLPIIAMTANAFAEDRANSLAAGMNDHVVKPIDRDNLFAVLMQWIDPACIDRSAAVVPPPEPPVSQLHAAALPDTLVGINLKCALDRLNGNRQLLRSLLLEFARDFADTDRRIEASLAGKRQSDLKDAERLAHSVKGMAGNIAAEKLFKTALTLEQAIRDGNRAQWPPLLQDFQTSLTQVVTSITVLSPADQVASHAAAIDWDQVRPWLMELENRLKNYNVLAQESLDVLKPLLQGSDWQQLLNLIEASLATFDFEVALAHCGTLMRMVSTSAPS
ncbi:MAG: response regulator [Magnetococcales bacterium]|nr:response regulator [Magnetococcales bacterium]